MSDYKDILRVHVLPVFGSRSISDITRGQIKDFLLNKSNQGYASSTVTHIKNVVSGVLNKAIDDEVIPANPCHGLGKIVKYKNRKETIDPLTAYELNLLLDTFKLHYPEHYTLVLLLARTGMRIGEALGIQWGDIDFNGRFIEVRRGISRGKVSTPKNNKTRRVDMSFQLREAMKRHRTESKKKGLSLGLGGITEYVFTNGKGNIIDINVWRRDVFKKALTKATLRRVRIHDLRHTYATLRIGKGDNIADVSNQLGHHSVKMTMDVYYHWVPGKKKTEVDELDNLHSNAPYTHPTTPKNKKWDSHDELTH